jgi:diketogulonate reductase-like aldo/keto reductase
MRSWMFEVAHEVDSTPARIAINWLYSQPGVTARIIGARTVDQLDNNLAALEVSLSSDQLSRLAVPPPHSEIQSCQSTVKWLDPIHWERRPANHIERPSLPGNWPARDGPTPRPVAR